MIFRLKCVGCGVVENRDAEKCKGDLPPFCDKCYMPMIVEHVSVDLAHKPKRKRK